VFFFSSRRRHTRSTRDWSSDVCSSDLLFALYLATDCSLAEINPLVTTKDGRVFALDAKPNFDDNALARQKDVAALRDVHEEDPRSEERRVGKESRARRSRGQWKTKWAA